MQPSRGVLEDQGREIAEDEPGVLEDQDRKIAEDEPGVLEDQDREVAEDEPGVLENRDREIAEDEPGGVVLPKSDRAPFCLRPKRARLLGCSFDKMRFARLSIPVCAI